MLKFLLACLVVLSLLLAGCQQPAATSSTSPTTTPPVSTPTTPAGTTPAGTSSPPVATTSVPNSLSRLQSNLHLEATFSALATFQTGATTLTFPTVYAVPLVPITWTGTSFKGELEEKGAGEDITDLVSGTVSSDGGTLVSLVYSRQIIRPVLQTGNFFRITLAKVPIASLVDGAVSGLGAFDSSGAALQDLIIKIEYLDGPLSNGQIAPTASYVSTDWTNPQPGQAPHLKVNFRP